MRQFKPIKKDRKKTVKQKAIKATQLERFEEESRKPRIKRNGILIG
jgi:hypothetical protein|tara:strand:+ start:3516 stop:3653 length:138 start_codon:yes stop_codon:yes gene_type:complete